jgi:hypothetical protein
LFSVSSHDWHRPISRPPSGPTTLQHQGASVSPVDASRAPSRQRTFPTRGASRARPSAAGYACTDRAAAVCLASRGWYPVDEHDGNAGLAHREVPDAEGRAPSKGSVTHRASPSESTTFRALQDRQTPGGPGSRTKSTRSAGKPRQTHPALDLHISNVVDLANYVVSALLPEEIFWG